LNDNFYESFYTIKVELDGGSYTHVKLEIPDYYGAKFTAAGGQIPIIPNGNSIRSETVPKYAGSNYFITSIKFPVGRLNFTNSFPVALNLCKNIGCTENVKVIEFANGIINGATSGCSDLSCAAVTNMGTTEITIETDKF
jgi:hypothetical protein